MTGFGSAEDRVASGRGRLRVDIRTVNHRYFNPQLKLPADLAGVEIEMRDRLRQLLERGHVAVTAQWADVKPIVERAVHDVVAMREREGRALAIELNQRLDALESAAREIEAQAPARLTAEHQRLKQAIVELTSAATVDEQRL